MELKVERFETSPDETFGRFYIDGILKCLTLEDTFRKVKIKGETRIQASRYKIELYNSPSFSHKYGHKMLHIMNVPEFEGVLIHCGNTNIDTKGCLLVGKKIGVLNNKRAVLDSKVAYNAIYPIISEAILKGQEVYITYIDQPSTV